MEDTTLKWEIIGMVFIILVGSLFHSLFDFTGKLIPLAPFLPTNESVWEHLKLTYTPGLIFFAIEYRKLKSSVNNFLLAKAVYFTVSPFVIIGGFYLNKLITGLSSLIFDISLFIVAIIVGQYISYKILIAEEKANILENISLIIIISWGLIFAIFSFWPPHLPPFYDTSKGLYGIPP